MDKVIRTKGKWIECNSPEMASIRDELGLDVNVRMTSRAWARTIGDSKGKTILARFRKVLEGLSNDSYEWDRMRDRVYFRATIGGRPLKLRGTVGGGDDGYRDMMIDLDDRK